MLPRRALPGASPACREGTGSRALLAPLLALAVLSLGCPQLLGDEFHVQLGNVAEEGDGVRREDGAPSGPDAGSFADPLVDPPDVPPSPTSPDAGDGDPSSPGQPDAAAAETPGDAVVLSVTPADAATGVAPEAVITVVFSEPMAPAAVEAAYRSSDLPPAGVSFSWQQDDTVLVITPAQPLQLGTGANVNTAVPLRYAFELASGALSADGDALPPFSSSFTTLRQITQTLGAEQDRSLSGNWRSDDVFGTNDCAITNNVACIGDSSNGNSTYRGFLTFDLGPLPDLALSVTQAQLRMSIDTIVGAPFPSLGTLGVEHVSFDGIGLPAFNSAPLGSLISISTSAGPGDQLQANVSTALAADVAARERSQFRFRFTTASNQNGAADMVELLCGTAQLLITYRLP